MSRVVFALTIIVILALGYLALQNPTPVQLKLFHRGPFEIPLYLVIFGGVVLGALFVYVLSLFRGVKGAFLGMRERRVRKRDERTDSHRQEARKQLRLGNLAVSKNLLERAIQLVPENLELSLDLADVLLEGKEFDEAFDRYHHILSRDSRNVRALLGIATSSENRDHFSEAELYYGRVIDVEKGNPVALRGLLRTQEAQKKWRQAMHTLRLLRKEGLVSSEEFADTLAVLWYEQGLTQGEVGHVKESISSLEKSLKVRRHFVPTLLSLGDAYIRDGAPERATKMWEGALIERFQPPLARAFEQHMVQQGREKEIIQFYKKASHQHELARLLLARFYLRKDRVEEADAEINRIADREASPEALLILAEVEKKRLNEVLANRHYSLAIELLHQQLAGYECGTCAAKHDRWVARCEKCGAWNTLNMKRFLP